MRLCIWHVTVILNVSSNLVHGFVTRNGAPPRHGHGGHFSLPAVFNPPESAYTDLLAKLERAGELMKVAVDTRLKIAPTTTTPTSSTIASGEDVEQELESAVTQVRESITEIEQAIAETGNPTETKLATAVAELEEAVQDLERGVVTDTENLMKQGETELETAIADMEAAVDLTNKQGAMEESMKAAVDASTESATTALANTAATEAVEVAPVDSQVTLDSSDSLQIDTVHGFLGNMDTTATMLLKHNDFSDGLVSATLPYCHHVECGFHAVQEGAQTSILLESAPNFLPSIFLVYPTQYKQDRFAKKAFSLGQWQPKATTSTMTTKPMTSFASFRRTDSRLAAGGSGRSRDDETYETLRPETSFGADTVPEAQRPVNEYLDVTSQPLFGWASLESGNQGLLLRLVATYVVVFALICYPIAGATYTQEGYLMQKIAASNVGAMSLLGLLMIRIYSGWGYIASRLTSKVIEFEETGWYDGDVELKSPAELQRDRFLYKDKVQPVVARLKAFSLAMGGLWLGSILAFNAAISYKPMFAQYDPKILEKMSYDEKLAEAAARSSGGKPIYCDSRYYRAIANGGQGCD